MTNMFEWHLPDRVLAIGRRPLVMGIINVTPDSFSDGGCHDSVEEAVAHGLRLVAEGADLLDVGGESTRPGSAPVPEAEELARVVPVVRELANRTPVPLSVDTSKAEVARQCLEAGAHIINDVTAMTGDPGMAGVARERRAAVILMHMQGTPATMQVNPVYVDVVADIVGFLKERLETVAAAGVRPEQAVLDPGIGFGKTAAHNLTILARLGEFQRLLRPVCLGISRKGFLGKILDRPVGERLAGSLAAVCWAMASGAVQVVRCHDVRPTYDAVTVCAAIAERLHVSPAVRAEPCEGA
jgi:dihydropteroate synthase